MTDTQNSAGEIEAVFVFAEMHHWDTTKAKAELAGLRAQIEVLQAAYNDPYAAEDALPYNYDPTGEA